MSERPSGSRAGSRLATDWTMARHRPTCPTIGSRAPPSCSSVIVNAGKLRSADLAAPLTRLSGRLPAGAVWHMRSKAPRRSNCRALRRRGSSPRTRVSAASRSSPLGGLSTAPVGPGLDSLEPSGRPVLVGWQKGGYHLCKARISCHCLVDRTKNGNKVCEFTHVFPVLPPIA